MPRVPKSHRCGNCRRRRVKCDVNWPTCTPCQRLGLECPGPQNLNKFVVNGSHATDDGDEGETTSERPSDLLPASAWEPVGYAGRQDAMPWFSIQSSGSRRAREWMSSAEAGTFGFFRLTPLVPRGLSGQADKVASVLVAHLSTERFADSATGLGYLRHVPRRLAESSALRACVSLFCSTWANYWRGLPASRLIDTRLQNRALSSLRRDLAGSRQLACETLAAVTMLQRLEAYFSVTIGPKPATHMSGLVNLIFRRGPPKISDELDVRLALENQMTMILSSVIPGSQPTEFTPEWMQAMYEAVSADDFYDYDAQVGSTFALEILYWKWPPLVHEIRAFFNHGTQPALGVADLHRRCHDAFASILEAGEPIMAKLVGLGLVKELPDDTSLTGLSYDFASVRYCNFLVTYVLCRMVFSQMLRDLSSLQGLEAAEAYHAAAYADHARSCLMFCPYLVRKGPFVRAQFTSALFFGIGGLQGAERMFLARFIQEGTGFVLPEDANEAAAVLERVVDGIIGYRAPTGPYDLAGSMLVPSNPIPDVPV